MRVSSFSGAFVSLLLGGMVLIPVASAQMGSSSSSYGPSPYPYFRRTVSSVSVSSSSSSRSSALSSSSSSFSRSSSSQSRPALHSSSSTSGAGSSSVMAGSDSSLSSTPTVGVSLEADRGEAYAGDDVRYWIHIRNLYVRDLPSWKIGFFFDRSQMQILETGGGRLEGNHVTFTVPSTRSNDNASFTVRVHLYKNLKPGTVIRTYGSMIDGGTISPACSKNELTILGRVPQTGAGDNTSPVEDLRAFLRPVSAASEGSPMPLIVWISVAGLGLTVGGGLGKKFIA